MSKRKGRYAILAGEYWRHHKTESLTLEAQAVYCRALSYCADNLTDGKIPVRVIRSWAGPKVIKRVIAELSSSKDAWPASDRDPLWVSAGETHWQVTAYLKRNISRADWDSFRASDRKRKQQLSLNFRGGSGPEFRAEAGRNSNGIPGGIPGGHSSPNVPMSLLRERGPSLDSSEKEEKQKKERSEKGNGKEETVNRVCSLWVEAGRRVTGDNRISVDPALEAETAIKLWDRAAGLQAGEPSEILARLFWDYWRDKRQAGKWPVLRFCLQEFDGYALAAPESDRRRELQIEAEREEKAREAAIARELQAQAGSEEWSLRRDLLIAQARADLNKTPAAREAYRIAKAKMDEYEKRGSADG